MSLDDVLVAIIIIGIVLSVTYLKAEYQLHVRIKAAQRKTGGVPHELRPLRTRIERNGMPVHVRIARAPMQSQHCCTVGFLTPNPPARASSFVQLIPNEDSRACDAHRVGVPVAQHSRQNYFVWPPEGPAPYAFPCENRAAQWIHGVPESK
jgi:hypothetical protein